MSEPSTTISTYNRAHAKAAPPAPRRHALAASAAKLSTIVRTWIARRVERRALREFVACNDQHMLADIGVTRQQAQQTAAKWFWHP